MSDPPAEWSAGAVAFFLCLPYGLAMDGTTETMLRRRVAEQDLIIAFLQEWIADLASATPVPEPARAPVETTPPTASPVSDRVMVRNMAWSLGIDTSEPDWFRALAVRGPDDEARGFQMPGGEYTNSCNDARAAWQVLAADEVVPFLRKIATTIDLGDDLGDEAERLVERLLPDWNAIENARIAEMAAAGTLKLPHATSGG